MRYGEIRGVGKPVSRIGQGTIMLTEAARDTGFALIDAVFEGGVNLFDCAFIYNGGECERVFGEWVRSRGVRDSIVLLDKGGHPKQNRSTINAADIRKEMNISLDRLGFDEIDLYLLHRDDPAVPVDEIVSFMTEHVREGRIRAWGGSNWTWERVRAANEYATAHDLAPMAASSPNFSLAVQFKPMWAGCISIAGHDGAPARQWYAAVNLPLLTWSSLARGFFSGRVTRENYMRDDVIEPCARQAFCYAENFERLDRATELAKERGLTVPQVALAYVLDYPLNTFPLVGPCTPDEFRENLAALNVGLTPEEIEWLDGRRKSR